MIVSLLPPVLTFVDETRHAIYKSTYHSQSFHIHLVKRISFPPKCLQTGWFSHHYKLHLLKYWFNRYLHHKTHKTNFLQHHSVTVYLDWPYIASEHVRKEKELLIYLGEFCQRKENTNALQIKYYFTTVFVQAKCIYAVPDFIYGLVWAAAQGHPNKRGPLILGPW